MITNRPSGTASKSQFVHIMTKSVTKSVMFADHEVVAECVSWSWPGLPCTLDGVTSPALSRHHEIEVSQQ